MTDRTPDLSELAPLARVITRTLADTPIRLGTPDTTPTLVAALTAAVAVYIGRDVLPPGALDQARPLVTTWAVEVQRASGEWCRCSAPHESRSEALADLARVQASGLCRYRLVRQTTIHTIEETEQ